MMVKSQLCLVAGACVCICVTGLVGKEVVDLVLDSKLSTESCEHFDQVAILLFGLPVDSFTVANHL